MSIDALTVSGIIITLSVAATLFLLCKVSGCGGNSS